MPEQISSVQNPRIKALVRLHEGSHRRRRERFLIEGHREVERALESEWPIESIFFCPEFFTDEAAFALIHTAEEKNIELIQLTEAPFQKASHRQGPDGLIAVGIQRQWTLGSIPLSTNPLLVVLEAIEKPGNLDAIFRTANAAGADALILAEAITDPFNPNTIRAAQGAFFQLPFASASNETVMAFLKERKITPIPTSPSGNTSLWDAPLSKPAALVFGAEDAGLSSAWLSSFTSYQLPMQGITDSLNVASMAAVSLFEAVRQRRKE